MARAVQYRRLPDESVPPREVPPRGRRRQKKVYVVLPSLKSTQLPPSSIMSTSSMTSSSG